MGYPEKAQTLRVSAEQLRQDVLWLVRSKVTILSDNEPALVHVVDRALKACCGSGVESALAEGYVPYGP